MKSALQTQIDGQHYKTQKIQPIELSYMIGGTPAFCKLAKYLTREKIDKKINLQKAFHCICLEEELVDYADYHYEIEHICEQTIKDTENLIKTFSSGSNEIYNALLTMYYRNYYSAKVWVNEYALKTVGEKAGEL